MRPTRPGLPSLVFLLFIAPIACEGQMLDDSGQAGENADSDLALGARGRSVRALHSYLTRFGYFPNPELADAYPAWRPAAEAPPGDENVFDGNTEQALRAFQHNHGLAETGVADAVTRALMSQPRCGVPDGIPTVDPAQKFDLLSSRWGKNALTWKVANSDTQVTLDQARSAVRVSLSNWARATNFTFAETTGTPDILIRFQDLYDENVGGSTSAPPAGDVTLNVSSRMKWAWSAASPTPSDRVDLQSIVQHELGHAIGLGHSSLQGAIMYGVYTHGTQKRTLAADDVAAKLALNMKLKEFHAGNFNVDAAFYSHPNGSELYVLGGGPTVAGGYTIWLSRSLSQNWTQLPGGAVSIAAHSTPWIVTDGRIIAKFNWMTSSWDQVPGCANEIAIGTDNSVWTLGCDVVAGGYVVQKWNGSSWDRTDRGAVSLSVGPRTMGGTIVPWIVNSAREIYRRTSGSATSGSWERLPGTALVIGVSAGGYAWSLSTTAVNNDYQLQIFNEQPADPPGTPSVPNAVQRSRWIPVPAYGNNVSGDSGGGPLLINRAGQAFTIM